MEDSIIIWLLVIFLCFTCIFNAHRNKVEQYELTSETIILDKFITYSRYGNPSYYLVFKDDEGTILQRNVNPDVYYRFEIDEMEDLYEKTN